MIREAIIICTVTTTITGSLFACWAVGWNYGWWCLAYAAAVTWGFLRQIDPHPTP